MMINKDSILKSREGFTLIELITVIILLGIISGIGIPKYAMMQAQSEWDADVVTLQNLEKATNLCILNNPDMLTWSDDDGDGNIDIDVQSVDSAGFFDAGTILNRKSEGTKSSRNTTKADLANWWDPDEVILEVDPDSGTVVWKDELPAAAGATPAGDGVNDWINELIGYKPPAGATDEYFPGVDY